MSPDEKIKLTYDLTMEYFKANPERFQKDESQIDSIVKEYSDIYKKFKCAINETTF